MRPLLVALLAVAALAAPAADADLARQALDAFGRGDYAAAEGLCRRQLDADAKDANAAYNLACALARQAKTDAALAALAQAQELGFADADHARADDDLAALRALPGFTRIVERMAAMPYASDQPYEAGEAIAGVRALEGTAEGGLRWRLRLGVAATRERPHRLVVWLHPSGGSANRLVERLAPDLAARGFALVVFTQKQWMGWTEDEMRRLVRTITALAAQDGVDARAPVLMGFSAGGQCALQLWQQRPEAWGGLLLDAAYPIDLARGIAAKAPLVPSPAVLAARTPMLALVGGNDGLLPVWRDALARWGDAPVTLRVVPGRGHEFLFAGEEWTAALEWLAGLAKAR